MDPGSRTHDGDAHDPRRVRAGSPSPAFAGRRVPDLVRSVLLLVNLAAVAACLLALFFLYAVSTLGPAPPAHARWQGRVAGLLGLGLFALLPLCWQLGREGRWPWAFQALAAAALAGVGLLCLFPPPGILGPP